MKVALVGCDGNMASRYRAILDFLGHQVKGWDKDAELEDIEYMTKWADAFIVCTPTGHHLGSLREIWKNGWAGKPVLCEKPVTKDIEQYKQLCKLVWELKPELYCVNQYAYLPEMVDGTADGLTSYNYFKHGSDGLKWDCFQLYALARGKLELRNTSPVWQCTLNGVNVDLSNMDRAYVDMVIDFLGYKRKSWGWAVIDKTTRRIFEDQ
jgi:hypothetical protein